MRLSASRKTPTRSSESASRTPKPSILVHRAGHHRGKDRHLPLALLKRNCARPSYLKSNYLSFLRHNCPSQHFRQEATRHHGNLSRMDRAQDHQPFPDRSYRRLHPFPARPPQPPRPGLLSRTMAKPSLVSRYNLSIRTTTPTHRLDFHPLRSFRQPEPTCQPGRADLREYKQVRRASVPTRLLSCHQSVKGQDSRNHRLKTPIGNPFQSPPSFRKVSTGVRDLVQAQSACFRTPVPSTPTCTARTTTNCKSTNWNCSPV